MSTIPHVLHFITPDHPSSSTTERIAKISRLHSDWTIHVWTDSVVPAQGRLSRYYSKSNSGAQLADLMRIDAVWAYGGIYIDSDFNIDLPLECLADNHQFFIGTEDGYFPTNALFGATREHPALGALIDVLVEEEPDWTTPANRTTGPYLFKRVMQWRADVDLLPRETFYPYHWSEAPRAGHRLSYGTHLWEGSWLAEDHRSEAGQASSTRQTLARRGQIEVSKFLSTVGFRQAGAALWDRAHGIRQAHGDTESPHAKESVSTYTVADEVFVRTLHRTILVCDGHDVSITPHLALNGFYEWAEEAFLKRTLGGGDWFVDVGANIGNHSILAASCVGPFGRVFAFEPNTRCADLMRKSAVLNWVHDRLKIDEVGVSDKVGEARFAFSASLLGGAAIDTGAANSDCLDVTLATLGGGETMTIGTTTLDATFPVDVPIKILKIDAEGHEPEILRGGARLLSSRAVDFIMVEAIVELSASHWRENVAAFEMLMGFGYKAARLSDDGSLVRHATLQAALDDDASRTLIFHA